MNEAQIRERARERLLSAELAELLQVEVAVIEAVELEPDRRPSKWLAAALLCFGVAVASGVAWLRTEPAQQAAQDPQGAFDPAAPWWEYEVPFRVPMVVVNSLEQIAALPTTTARITVGMQGAQEGAIGAVLRRDGLQQLLLVGPNTAALPIPWADLATHDSLRSLGFIAVAVQAEQLRQLARLPELRALTVSHQSIKIDAVTASALAQVKTLRQLNISYDEVDPEALKRLADLPALTSLVLGVAQSGPGDLTAQLAAVAQIRTLRTLYFDGSFDPMPADALRQLRGLPNLIALQLANFKVDDAGLAALPRQLQHLQLPALGAITPAGIASLAGLGSLRSLSFHYSIPEECDAAVRDLVPKLPLECFECLIGQPSDSLWSVLAGLPLLRRVRVLLGDEDPSSVFEHALACRKLEVLFVSVPKMPSPEQLRCLGEHPTLRRIVFNRYLPSTPVPTAAELAALRASVRAEIEVL
ncbi:MAG: hypothetical protein KA020_06345 [Planctomycetes bacterium]|jgi:hypothetical protein|nr:hypothetical protein [Planctomycetota bacterium]